MIGVIHYAYGAPKSLDELGDYFSHIMQGKTPPPQVLDGLTKRYRSLGTCDPMSAATDRQARGLQQVLNQYFDQAVRVYNAYTHTHPFVDETVRQMVEDGVTTIVTLSITPIFSKNGIGTFRVKVRDILDELEADVEVVDIEDLHQHHDLVSALVNRVEHATRWLPADARPETKVLFTVHSQPVNPEMNEIYVQQFGELAEAIANQLQLPNWKLAYRSAAPHGEWLGPDVLDVIRMEAEQGTKGIVTCDLLAMVADIESYFEIGQECRDLCHELGLEFAQAEFLGDSFDFVMALANIVIESIELGDVAQYS